MRRSFACITATTLLLSTLAMAQSTNDRAANAPTQDADFQRRELFARYVAVEKLEGATCCLQRSPGSDQDNETEIVDMLIDSRTGALRWAVLSAEDGQVLVPVHKLRWDAQQDCFQSDMSVADLAQLEAFAPDENSVASLDAAVVSAEQRWGKQGGTQSPDSEGAMARRAQEASARARSENPKYPVYSSAHYRISKLDELELYGPEDELASVTRSIVDRNSMEVAFFVVNTGPMGVAGDAYLLPFHAARISAVADDGDAEPRLYANMTESQLEAATPYEESEDGVLDEAAAQRARAMRAHAAPMEQTENGRQRDQRR